MFVSNGVRLRRKPRNPKSEFNRELSARLGFDVAQDHIDTRAAARGVVGKLAKNREVKEKLDRKRAFQFEATQASKPSVFSKLKNFLVRPRGNR